MDGGDNAARCPLTAHRLNPVAHRSTTWGGTPPQTPPRFAALRGFFKKMQGEGDFAGNTLPDECCPQSLRSVGTTHRAPDFPHWLAGSRGPCAEGRTGGAALGGRGGAAPPVEERPRRGP